MPLYRIVTSEILDTYFELEIPDDCPDPTQYFYDYEHLALKVGTDSHQFQVESIEKEANND